MAKEVIIENEVVSDTPFPGQDVSQVITGATGGESSTVITNKTTKEQTFPKKRTAVELLSAALNTRSKKILQEFELTQSGGLQIGNFQEGQTGDVRITPNGITARDIAGLTTFALDATTGDAIFKGIVQAGSFVAGRVTIGSNRVIIEVDENGNGSIIVNDGVNDRVLIGFDEGGF